MMLSAICCRAPASAAINRYFLHAQCSAANPGRPLLLLSIDGTDRRMNTHPTVTQTLLNILCRQHQKYEKYGEAVALLTVKHAMYNVTVNGNEKFT